MSLRATVDALAKRIGLGPASAPAPCSVCAPRATPGRTTRILAPGQPARSCGACGRALDHTGAPIGVMAPRGTYTLTIGTDVVQAPTAQ